VPSPHDAVVRRRRVSEMASIEASRDALLTASGRELTCGVGEPAYDDGKQE
jgi:hypothetical protein